MNKSFPSLDELPTAPASDLHQQGWSALMRIVNREGALLITNHKTPEVVIVSVAHYERLIRAAEGTVDHSVVTESSPK